MFSRGRVTASCAKHPFQPNKDTSIELAFVLRQRYQSPAARRRQPHAAHNALNTQYRTKSQLSVLETKTRLPFPPSTHNNQTSARSSQEQTAACWSVSPESPGATLTSAREVRRVRATRTKTCTDIHEHEHIPPHTDTHTHTHIHTFRIQLCVERERKKRK